MDVFLGVGVERLFKYLAENLPEKNGLGPKKDLLAVLEKVFHGWGRNTNTLECWADTGDTSVFQSAWGLCRALQPAGMCQLQFHPVSRVWSFPDFWSTLGFNQY